MKVLTITGYKPHEIGIFHMKDPKIQVIKHHIRQRLQAYMEEGLEWVLISGQAGIELWAAEVVIAIPSLKLAVIPPFQHQEAVWKEAWQEKYHSIIQQADFFRPLVQKGYESPHQFRQKDQWLISKSDGCLVIYDDQLEGSPKYFIQQLEKMKPHSGYIDERITFLNLEEAARELSEQEHF
ncbi:putative phage-like protein YoqJ [Melghiribacillus thermohalophilus]|uniref:Putative phage-like protein YoqJ n=1 Tax=Melghiribacillus thermohalophilus TaxID=1324956 RepID=A0A4R3N854_9BACI|nr:SLOG family protein [Melghiribacillus thermohalophilus]TCT25533.1 putative phage-like protein YoqJ [Melghiribacillus thermohalophilus]